MARHSSFREISLAWLGLVAGTVGWSINTQWGQIAPYVDCTRHLSAAAVTSFGGAAVAALAGVASWRSQNYVHQPNSDPIAPWHFIRLVSALSAPLFAFALTMQGVASLIINACDR
jgi:hypothetical protein